MNANLLVTYDPTHVGKAEEEVRALLGKLEEEVQIYDSNVEGVFLLRVEDSKVVVKKLRELCKEDPSRFNYTFHWVPVEKWCPASLVEISKIMKEFDEKMDPDKSWKLELAKRYFEMGTTELIMKLTENIDKPKVDLKTPEIIISVQILGDKAGLSLLDSDEFLNVPKFKK